jgi:hypothetical protein
MVMNCDTRRIKDRIWRNLSTNPSTELVAQCAPSNVLLSRGVELSRLN